MADLQVWEKLHNQRMDQMIYALISFPFEPYALEHMVISDRIRKYNISFNILIYLKKA